MTIKSIALRLSDIFCQSLLATFGCHTKSITSPNMSKPKPCKFENLDGVVDHLRDVLDSCDDDGNEYNCVLLFGHNGTGKTRLSMKFKDKKTENDDKDTLYYNAFTEDLFSWNNDFKSARVKPKRYLNLNTESKFFRAIKINSPNESPLKKKIDKFVKKYASFEHCIEKYSVKNDKGKDTKKWRVIFRRGDEVNIKISRGEENIFIWCFFLAIYETAIDIKKAGKQDRKYDWIENVYIDDPISSLDDNNAISVAIDLVKLLNEGKENIKVVISTHHSLFYNVMWNEIRGYGLTCKKYFFSHLKEEKAYTLKNIRNTPFLYHVAMLAEIQQVIDDEDREIRSYHFNALRSIMEKTAIFLGEEHFSDCIKKMGHLLNEVDKGHLERILHGKSHGNDSILETNEPSDEDKEIFIKGFKDFVEYYRFNMKKIQKYYPAKNK